MAELIAIVGASGSGKSTSLRNLDPKSTFIINVTGKSLPFPGYKKNYTPFRQDPETKKFIGNLYNTSDVNKIAQALKIIDKHILEVKERLDFVRIISNFVFSNNRREKKAIELQRDLESLAANSIYAKAAELSLIK